MLISSRQTLEDYIVRILAARRSVTPAILHQEIGKLFCSYSMPAVYKELRKLQDQGVIVKREGELSLSLAWVLNLIELTDQMYDMHVETPTPTDILPVDSNKTSYGFSNLSKVDDFWVHAVILMLQHSDRKMMYQWFPHPWFNLINSHKTFPFHNALRAAGFRIKNILGGDNFLDRRADRFSTRGIYEYSFAPGPFQEERRKYYSVSDRFILTVRLTTEKAQEIDRFYDSVESLEDFDLSAAMEMTTKAPGTVVTVETSKSKIKKIWNKFADYYNVSSESKL